MSRSEQFRIVDTHCHLGFDADAAGPPAKEQVARAQALGVVAIIDVGIDPASSEAALARARSIDGVFASVGLHPDSCADYAEALPALRALAVDEACVAIGETGLDLYWDRVPLEVQLASLQSQLDLACQVQKPVILHCRDAFPELFAALAHEAPVRGVLHCFTGDVDAARACLDLGLHVSFAGPLTYPRNNALREAARFVPADRVLVETDAPFLPPQSRRGSRNEASGVVEVLTTLAATRGVPLAEMAETCTANSDALFGLKL